MEKEKLIGTFTVSDASKVDLFRIHLFDKSIRFDECFAKGLAQNAEVTQRILNISINWTTGKIGHEDVFMKVIEALKDYDEYLSLFYFNRLELDNQGRYIEPIAIETLDGIMSPIDITFHFQHLKRTNKLKEITKKEFESNIIDNKAIDFYVENYTAKNAKYYHYKISQDEQIKRCYLMSVENKVKLGFSAEE